jgi:ABC-type multidrug transport system ATPase subunit
LPIGEIVLSIAPAVELKDVTKRYNEITAVNSLSLSVETG